ncbi:MAG: CAP domain-containing protein [Armatimonadota bacterium]|nr:CAP domain-containing protein [Armatimonadota bacterium]
MLIPLVFTLFSHHKPLVLSAAAHSARPKFIFRRHGQVRPTAIRRTAVKADLQFVILASPALNRSVVLRQNLPQRLMPLTASLRLDTRVQEQQEEADLIAAINNERVTRGMEPLAEDPLLNVTARGHSREMCFLGYFDHHSPTPGQRTPLDRYLAALHAWGEDRPDAALVGENIFYASVTDASYNAAYAHQRLMDSPPHRANILEPRFTKVGVGLYRDSQGHFWVTEMFLRDKE